MIARASRALLARALAVAALIAAGAAGAACDARVVDAVDLGVTPDGGPQSMWPNATSSANSDPWIAAHHDAIIQMQPRLLVLDFYNPWSASQAQARAQDRIAALAEGSRYHFYSDGTAPVFLAYDLVGVVDLTDDPPPASWQHASSTRLPVDGTGAFDMSALFTTAFAASYGVPDPADPSRDLTLCELFEQGIVNEVWLLVGDEDGPRRPPLMVESKQVYDAQNRPVAGMFDPNTGYQPFVGPACNVTVRLANLSPTRGVDCDLTPRSGGIENMGDAVPYLAANASDFFNHDFAARDGATFNGWADLVATGTGGWCQSTPTACIAYPGGTVAAGTFPDGTTWTMNPFLQGCGTAHFPPNARFEWDYANSQAVNSRCEHYAMHDGLGGGDIPSAYSNGVVTAYTQQFGDDGCGGGWQIYYPQSMPGLHNTALAVDGTPMKNWWPFLFY